ncbi:unnamed protein product [Urochloa humidicola]
MALAQQLLLVVVWCCSCRRVCGYSSPPSAAGCVGSGAPVLLPEPLGFCGNVGLSCCNPAADAALREQFDAMNAPESDTACATIVKAILCQRCIPSPFPPPPVNSATINSIPPRCTSPRTPSSSSALQQQQEDAVCLERLAAAPAANTYVGMAAHPDGSGRAFLYTQEGKIWLLSVPPRGSGGAAINVAAGDGALLFLDLTARGLMLTGLALHPEFATNGRFFVSYAEGESAGANGSGWPSRNQLVLAEFSVNPVDSGMATRSADPTEVRRIFTMGVPQLPYASNQQYGGQILFRPGHGYLYLITGHGGDEATSPFVGKIIKFYVDRVPGSEPEIFATGPSNPRGCSFDSEKPFHLYCVGVDEQGDEQVYLMSVSDTAAANYSASTANNKAAVSLIIIDHGRPTAGAAPSIAGGIVYRGLANPLLNGRYLYIYASSLWAALETRSSNGMYQTTRISNIRCSGSGPVPCGGGVGIAGSIVSLGQDNSRDALIITTGGIYRVIPPSLCAGGARPLAPPPPPQKATSSWLVRAASILGSAATPFAIYLFYSCLCGGGGGSGGGGLQPTATNSCAVTFTCCSRGTTTNDKSNAPTGGQQGGWTGSTQVELDTRT